MGQLSFFSAEALDPRIEDLAGLLCGPGRLDSFGRVAARLSVVVAAPWRAKAIAAACAERGVTAEATRSDAGNPLVRTQYRIDLIPLADCWLRGSEKAVPAGVELNGAGLRMWALAAGIWSERGYLLGLDPDAPHTYEALGGALARCGVAAALRGVRDGRPGLQVTGRRRLARLAELVGLPPVPEAAPLWPAASRVSVTM